MKNNRNSIELQKLKEKEKEIKIFNENLKVSPELLDNDFYLFKNMAICRLNLKQIPSKHFSNILLMTDYFKYSRDSLNYKYIKPEILNNTLFLSQVITSNPDLYFIISEQNKILFKEVIIKSNKEYLKYLSDKDFDDPNRVKGIVDRFSCFQKSLSFLSLDNFKKLVNSPLGDSFLKSLNLLSLEQCNYLKEPLNSYIKEKTKERGFSWFSNILIKNPYLYTALDKEEHKDKDMKEFMVKLVGKYNNLFTFLPDDWKKDLKFIVKVIKVSVNSNIYYIPNSYCHAMVKEISIILNEYKSPEEFIKEKLNTDEMMIHLREVYPKLSIGWRNQEEIIKGLFKERDSFIIDLDYCRSIPDEILAEKLVSELKILKKRELGYVGENLESIVRHHFMDKNFSFKEEGILKKIKI